MSKSSSQTLLNFISSSVILRVLCDMVHYIFKQLQKWSRQCSSACFLNLLASVSCHRSSYIAISYHAFTSCTHTAHIQHTYYRYSTHTVHIQHTYSTHTAHILQIQHTYSTHTAHIQHTYSKHTAHIVMHTTHIQHTYSTHTAHIQHTYSTHTHTSI